MNRKNNVINLIVLNQSNPILGLFYRPNIGLDWLLTCKLI